MEKGAGYCGAKLTQFEERELEDKNILIKVFRPFFLIDTVGTEEWLSEMEVRGLNLYKVNLGMFYFIKGKPRIMKYLVLNRSVIDDETWTVYYRRGLLFERSILGKDLKNSFEDLSEIEEQIKKESLKTFIIYLVSLMVFIYLDYSLLKSDSNLFKLLVFIWLGLTILSGINYFRIRKKYNK